MPAELTSLAAATRAVYPAQQTCADKTLRTFDEVLAHIQSKSDVAAMTVAINAFPQRVFDLSALTALSSVKKSPLRFGCPQVFDSLEEGYRQLANYSFVLLDTRPTLSTIPPHKRSEPYSMLSEDLASRYQQNRLSEVGLKTYATFKIDDAEVVILQWTDVPAIARGTAPSAR